MNKGIWAIVASGGLIAIWVLDLPNPLRFAGTLFLAGILLTVFLTTCLVFVLRNQALVVCSRWDDRVIRVIEGPDWCLLNPLYEQERVRLDTTWQLQEVRLAELLLADQQPVILRFAVKVIFELVPQKLKDPRQLGQVLPFLTDGVRDILEMWIDYLMRRLVLDTGLNDLDGRVQERLEQRLIRLLNDRLNPPVAVHRALLVIRPPAGLCNALTKAELRRVGIVLQEEQMNKLLRALDGLEEEARSLALLEVARGLGDSDRTWTALDLGRWLGIDDDFDLSLVTGQLPWWPTPARAARRVGRGTQPAEKTRS